MFWLSFLLWAVVFAALGGFLGEKLKGKQKEGTLLGFFLGPIGCAFVLLLADVRPRCHNCRTIYERGARVCPRCLEKLPVAAVARQ